jgi:putative membrane protein
MNPFLAIGFLASAIFVLTSVFSHGPSTYRFAFIFLTPFLWAVYAARRRLALHPLHFGFFAIALLIHNLGAFGFYRQSPFGVEFDTYVHYFFGFAGGSVVARALDKRLPLNGWQTALGAILLVMGVGALHELMEYFSTLALGPEKGMLKINDGDIYDTQKDLLNNLMGAITAVLLYQFSRKRLLDHKGG